ncbi:MAG: hypothetical protein GY803_10700 [Chloroflexi bacterium]|nr:hypothetical protein [Chloroflexota bacterium]
MMEKRSSIVGGLILILVGSLFLLMQLFPSLADQVDFARQWPLMIVAVGAFFLLAALFGAPPLAIPGSIVGGIGGILYYQNLTGNWASWAYVWALIPGFVGIGIFLMHMLRGQFQKGIREGGPQIAISAVMFVVFAAFFNGLGGLGQYWPVLLILVGGWLLLKRR